MMGAFSDEFVEGKTPFNFYLMSLHVAPWAFHIRYSYRQCIIHAKDIIGQVLNLIWPCWTVMQYLTPVLFRQDFIQHVDLITVLSMCPSNCYSAPIIWKNSNGIHTKLLYYTVIMVTVIISRSRISEKLNFDCMGAPLLSHSSLPVGHVNFGINFTSKSKLHFLLALHIRCHHWCPLWSTLTVLWLTNTLKIKNSHCNLLLYLLATYMIVPQRPRSV